MTRGKIEKSELGIHLDVGHDSIGWCVTRTFPGNERFLAIPGTGVVLFPADDCLANSPDFATSLTLRGIARDKKPQ